MSRYRALLVLFVAAWSFSAAHAQSDEGVEPTHGERRYRPMRGLYVRGGLGFGGFKDNVIATGRETGDGSEGTATGMGMTSELAVGGAIGDNLALGGGIWNAYVVTSHYTHISGESIPGALQRPESATLVGLMADWRLVPELGVHDAEGERRQQVR